MFIFIYLFIYYWRRPRRPEGGGRAQGAPRRHRRGGVDPLSRAAIAALPAGQGGVPARHRR
eukprot:207060-Pyramimonas_sp.AAC.1